jgi:DNA-directed RNA polymerase sigma subunit (sigma70/sigma32)
MPKGYPGSHGKCPISGCGRWATSFGFCQRHYVTLYLRASLPDRPLKNTVTAGLMDEVMDQRVDPKSLPSSDKDDLALVFEALEKAGLNVRQRNILNARYGIGEKEQTLLEIGRRFKITREYVRQIETLAINKLRRWVNLKLKLAGYEGLKDVG